MSIKTFGVIGAGIMGNGIAQIAAQSGYQVVMRDVENRFVHRGMQTIQDSLERMVKKEKLTKEESGEVLGRIKGTTTIDDLAPCELIVEAIIEDRDLKGKLYQEISKVCDPQVIIASNTSSYPVKDLAFFAAHPENFLGLHFFNPVPVIQLVEIVRGPVTADDTIAVAKEFVSKIGKIGVEVKDSSLVNRIFLPMINEAINVFEEGIVSAEEIDKSMKLALNHPMGPLALLDLMGLDTILAVMEIFYASTGDPKYRPSSLLRQKVEAGHLGRKSGRGIYQY